MERVLALDYGRKRIGVAGCDPLGITVQPLEAVAADRGDPLARIAAVCDEREVDRVVVGLPRNMDGTEGPMAAEARAFGARVAAATGRTVVFHDERLSSAGAEDALRGQTPKQRQKMRKEGRIDAMAAAQVLRDYLAARDRGEA